MPENKISLTATAGSTSSGPATPPATPAAVAPAASASPAATKPGITIGPAVTASKPASAASVQGAAPTPAPGAAAPGAVSFQNIFSQQKTETKGPKMIDSILAKQSGAPQMKPILGKAPTLQKSLEQEREIQQKKKLRLFQTVFLVVFFSALAMVGYFYSELSPTFDLFGPNTTARLTDVNRNLRSLQTQVNKYRYLTAQLDLNAFSLVADDFLDKTSKMNAGGTLTAATIAQATEDMPGFVATIRENLTPDIVLPLYQSAAETVQTEEEIRLQFQDDLKKAITEDRNKIAAGTDLTDVNKQELRLMDNAIKLVGNTRLLNAVKSSSTESFQQQLDEYVASLDPAQRQQLQTFIGTLLSSTKSEIASIGALKNSRINWSKIIKSIEDVTRKIDTRFGQGLTEAIGEGIIYTGYEFEASSNKIVLSGVTLTNDAYNFTVITKLIDELEKDPLASFKNVEMRSFAKSGTPEEGYNSNFKIDLEIEPADESTESAPISLEKKTVAQAAGIKRSK